MWVEAQEIANGLGGLVEGVKGRTLLDEDVFHPGHHQSDAKQLALFVEPRAANTSHPHLAIHQVG